MSKKPAKKAVSREDRLKSLLKEVRMKLAENPKFDVGGLVEQEPGELWEASARGEFIGAFFRDGELIILARMLECIVPARDPQWGYEQIREHLRDQILKLIPILKSEKFQLWIYDVMEGDDLSPPAEVEVSGYTGM